MVHSASITAGSASSGSPSVTASCCHSGYVTAFTVFWEMTVGLREVMSDVWGYSPP